MLFKVEPDLTTVENGRFYSVLRSGIDDLRGEKCYAALFSLFVGMHSASSSQPENVEG